MKNEPEGPYSFLNRTTKGRGDFIDTDMPIDRILIGRILGIKKAMNLGRII
jgi:hypothetical protein